MPLQQMRHPAPGDPRWLCLAEACQEIATHGWQRVHPEGTEQVVACEDDRLSWEASSHLHRADCPAPGHCACTRLTRRLADAEADHDEGCPAATVCTCQAAGCPDGCPCLTPGPPE